MKNLRCSEWLGKLLTPSPHYKLENKDLYFTLTTAWNSNSPLYLNFLNKIIAIKRKRKLPFLTSGEVNFSQATSSFRVCAFSVTSVGSNSLWPCRFQPARLLCSWDSPGKNTGMGYYVFLQRIFLTQWSNTRHQFLLHCK